MRRLILALASVAAFAGPLAVATAAEAQGRHGRHDKHWDRGHGDHRGHGDKHWDRGRHNGYYYRNQWYYGPPPQAYYADPYYRPGYAAWRRGAYLPPSYRGYVVHDYGYYRLRPPPHGYAWYRVDNDYLLAAVATGLIFDIINDH
jgi:Ni/Co efflux regulator RcnB